MQWKSNGSHKVGENGATSCGKEPNYSIRVSYFFNILSWWEGVAMESYPILEGRSLLYPDTRVPSPHNGITESGSIETDKAAAV